MALSKRYNPKTAEPRLQAWWQEHGVYHYAGADRSPRAGEKAVRSIDTPPPTVSGHLHLGHVYSYSHPDFIARFWRMRGYNVFYPMGYDDNGLPTERLVERRLGVRALAIGRQAFIEKCLQISEQAEQDYQALWQRLGLSIDWRYTYRTIDDYSRRTSQYSFIDLYNKGLVYRREAPAIWCPECGTAIAQAELNDLERRTEFVTLRFDLGDGSILPVATTRPELLPACVAVFVHPEDERYQGLAGKQAGVPLFGQEVPIIEDRGVDPEKGTGAVMCCTFGDTADVAWWYSHKLPLIEALDRSGEMTEVAGDFAGMTIEQARRAIKDSLAENGLLLNRMPAEQSIRVHERCDTPVEYIVARQWFVRILENREEFLQAGEQVRWHPEHMQSRYRAWVENLSWDWCISRQRYFGVPFPVWYCARCGEISLANPRRLPVDPLTELPDEPCTQCGGTEFTPEEDVMDTWATSSLSPEIIGRWLPKEGDQPVLSDDLFEQVYPFTLRPQAHEIIRTWAFYTIVKSHYHLGRLPWQDVLISGWGLAGEGLGKISKSRGGGPLAPMEMIERYSADAVRYWAASTGPGKDATISEEKIQLGAKLVTKLWNISRFSERFLESMPSAPSLTELSGWLTPADRWILSRTQRLLRRVTDLLESYEYANAKSEIEAFFWTELADNYLEMAKQRLYEEAHPQREAARATLYHSLLTMLKLLAPYLPFVTEEVYLNLFTRWEPSGSIHNARWPEPLPDFEDDQAEGLGEALIRIATVVRRFKSENNLPLSAPLKRLQLATNQSELRQGLNAAGPDLKSITRTGQVEVVSQLDAQLHILEMEGPVGVALEMPEVEREQREEQKGGT